MKQTIRNNKFEKNNSKQTIRKNEIKLALFILLHITTYSRILRYIAPYYSLLLYIAVAAAAVFTVSLLPRP